MTAMRRRAAVLVAGGVLLTSCASAGTSPGGRGGGQVTGVTKDTILIGTSNALTGPVGSVCKPTSAGASAWFDKVNAAGGVHGRKIDDKVLDDAYQAPRAAANVRSLQSSGVFALFGGCGTITAATIASIVKGTETPYLFPYAALPALVHPTQSNVYSLLPLYGDQARSMIPYVMKRDGAGPLYAVTTQIPGYEANVAGAKAGTKTANAKFLDSALLPAVGAPFQQAALKVSSAHPDYLMLTVLAPDAARMLNTMAAAGRLPAKRILGVSVLGSQSFADALAAPAASLLETASPTVPAGDPRAAECLTALKKYAPSVKPDALAIFGCATAQVFVAALEKAGQNLTRASLAKALDSLQNAAVSPLLPPVTFTADNHMGLNSMFLLQLKSGRFEIAATLPITTEAQ
jgi:branched-chain amino acid transport system substrate-binding protein